MLTTYNPNKNAPKTVGKVSIVTGASRGIGAGVARQLLSEDWRVAVVARSDDGLYQICAEAGPCSSMAVVDDLREPSFAQRIKEETLKHFGRIDALVNIAGDAPQASVLELTDAQWEQAFSPKHCAPQRLTRMIWPELKQTKGAVIFLSGVTARTPLAALGTIGSVNGAILAASKAWAQQGEQDGVRVNTVLPGAVRTQRRDSIIALKAKKAALQ